MLDDDTPIPDSDDQRPRVSSRKGRLESGNAFDMRYYKPSGERLDYPVDGQPEFGETLEVAPGILWTRSPLPFSLEAINLYLLDDGDGWTIVDCGLNTSMVRSYWDQLFDNELAGKPVNRVLATHYHPDHFGLAGWLVERTGAPLYMSRAEFLLARSLYYDVRDDVPDEVIGFFRAAGFPEQGLQLMQERGFGNYARGLWAPPLGYQRLRHGDTLQAAGRQWRIIEGSGHSPEHACLFSEDDHILISGDQLLPKITSNVSVYPTEPMGEPLSDWLASLARLEKLPEDSFVLPSHNEPFRGVHQRCKDIRAAHVRRLVSLVDLCRDEPKSVVGAFPVLFRQKLSGVDFVLAAGEALAHLRYLEARGIVRREHRDDVNYFQTVGEFDPDGVEAEFR